jgi:hypothetical protein
MEQQNITLKPRPQVKKVSKPFYLGSYIGSGVATFIILVAMVILIAATVITAVNDREPSWILILNIIWMYILLFAISIYSTVITIILVYKAWQAIDDGKQRTSPGKAVGFYFIPYFNFYWLFQIYWGYAKDYNAFLDRYQLNLKKLSENTFLTFCITVLVCIIPGINVLALIVVLIYGGLVINQQCDAINNLVNVN